MAGVNGELVRQDYVDENFLELMSQRADGKVEIGRPPIVEMGGPEDLDEAIEAMCLEVPIFAEMASSSRSFWRQQERQNFVVKGPREEKLRMGPFNDNVAPSMDQRGSGQSDQMSQDWVSNILEMCGKNVPMVTTTPIANSPQQQPPNLTTVPLASSGAKIEAMDEDEPEDPIILTSAFAASNSSRNNNSSWGMQTHPLTPAAMCTPVQPFSAAVQESLMQAATPAHVRLKCKRKGCSKGHLTSLGVAPSGGARSVLAEAQQRAAFHRQRKTALTHACCLSCSVCGDKPRKSLAWHRWCSVCMSVYSNNGFFAHHGGVSMRGEKPLEKRMMAHKFALWQTFLQLRKKQQRQNRLLSWEVVLAKLPDLTSEQEWLFVALRYPPETREAAISTMTTTWASENFKVLMLREKQSLPLSSTQGYNNGVGALEPATDPGGALVRAAHPSISSRFARMSFTAHIALVVDDDLICRKITSKVLTKWVPTIMCAENGSEAVEAYNRLDQYRNTNAHILILMDILMPKMNGIVATRMIRTLESCGSRVKATIIARSSNCDLAFQQMYRDAGMDGCLQKGGNINEQIKAIFDRSS